jgi:hypothetical protein
MWDLSWTKWYWDRFLSEFFGIFLSIPFHRDCPYSYIWWMNNGLFRGSSSETQSRPIDKNNNKPINAK